MIFAGIDVDIITHEKALAAGIEAFGLWAWCMCWTHKHTTDGRIPRVAIMSALNEKPSKIRRGLVRLCSSGLLNETETGDFVLHNYGKKNQTAQEIAARVAAGKAANAARQQRSREREQEARNARVTPTSERDETLRVTRVTGLQPELQPEPSLQPPPDPDTGVRRVTPMVLGHDGEGGSAWHAWRTGISTATGKPVSELQARDKPDLVAFVNAHSGGLRGEPLMAWISETASAFVRAVDGKFGGFTTKRCREWLDTGRLERTANGVPRQPIGAAASAPWMTTTENFDFGATK